MVKQEFGMVNTGHGLYTGMVGCTKPLNSTVLRQISTDWVIPQLLFGYCTLVRENTEFLMFGLVEIPLVRLE